jgi:hypothetical protein
MDYDCITVKGQEEEICCRILKECFFYCAVELSEFYVLATLCRSDRNRMGGYSPRIMLLVLHVSLISDWSGLISQETWTNASSSGIQ